MPSKNSSRAGTLALVSKPVRRTLEARLAAYRSFLNDAWEVLPAWLRTREDGGRGLRDWFQTNWEMLVESPLQEALAAEEGYVEVRKRCAQVYGEGAACNRDGDLRIAYSGFDASHEIRVNGDDRFYAFGTVSDGCFVQTPPFDLVQTIDVRGSRRVVPAGTAAFSVVRTESFHALYVESDHLQDAFTSTPTIEGLPMFLLLVGIPALLAGGAAYFLGTQLGENIPALAMGVFAALTYLIWGARETPVEIVVNLVIYYLLALGITTVVPGPVGEVTAMQLLYAILLGVLVSLVFFLVARLFLPSDEW